MADQFDPNSNTLLLASGMQDAEKVVNRAIQVLAALGQLSVVSGITTNNNTPPGSPNDGDTYFVGTSPPSGVWEDHDSEFAHYVGNPGGWFFTPPKEGWLVFDKTSKIFYRRKASTWIPFATKQPPFFILSPTSQKVIFFRAEQACTVRSATFVIGAATSVTIDIRHGTDQSAAGTALLTGTTLVVNNTTTGQVVTTFNDATLAAGEWMWVTVSSPSGSPGHIFGTLVVTDD